MTGVTIAADGVASVYDWFSTNVSVITAVVAIISFVINAILAKRKDSREQAIFAQKMLEYEIAQEQMKAQLATIKETSDEDARCTQH